MNKKICCFTIDRYRDRVYCSSYNFGIYNETSNVAQKILEDNIIPLKECGIENDLRVIIASKTIILQWKCTTRLMI